MLFLVSLVTCGADFEGVTEVASAVAVDELDGFAVMGVVSVADSSGAVACAAGTDARVRKTPARLNLGKIACTASESKIAATTARPMKLRLQRHPHCTADISIERFGRRRRRRCAFGVRAGEQTHHHVEVL